MYRRAYSPSPSHLSNGSAKYTNSDARSHVSTSPYNYSYTTHSYLNAL